MESLFGRRLAAPPLPAACRPALPPPAAGARSPRAAARRRLAAALLLTAVGGARAQSPAPADAAPPGMRQALDAAWALDAQARSLPDRRAALDARARATGALFAGPAAIGVFQRNDRLQRHTGFGEAEAEIAVPLWNPGTRQAARQQVASDREALDRSLPAARLQLAGELREQAARAAQARIARDAALRRRQSAAVLAEDVARRVRAGESARLESLQAEALRGQAAADLADAERALAQAEAQWTALTGLAAVAALEDDAAPDGDPAGPAPAAAAGPGDGGGHPLLRAAEARAAAARSQLDWVLADRRDPVEVGIGMSREQSAHGERSDRLLRVSLRIPLSSEHRNAPRQAAARAEVSAAEADAEAVARQVDAAGRAARAALDAARRAAAAADERARLSAEAQELVARAYRLGESSLPDRLRAENERYDAERARALARTEVQRARSQLLQAQGRLP